MILDKEKKKTLTKLYSELRGALNRSHVQRRQRVGHMIWDLGVNAGDSRPHNYQALPISDRRRMRMRDLWEPWISSMVTSVLITGSRALSVKCHPWPTDGTPALSRPGPITADGGLSEERSLTNGNRVLRSLNSRTPVTNTSNAKSVCFTTPPVKVQS